MSGSAEYQAHGASETPNRPEAVVNLATANRMVPLVRRIVEDILRHQRQLAQLQPEQERLDRQRRTLNWPERARRYQLSEELAAEESSLLEAMAELEVLGVALVDPESGRIGFPTIVNERPAFFSWQPGEETLRYWHFGTELVRRAIPASWAKHADIRLVGKS